MTPSTSCIRIALLGMILATGSAATGADDMSRKLEIGPLLLELPRLDNPERLDRKRPGCKALIGGDLGEARVEIIVQGRPGSPSSEPEDATDWVLRRSRPASDRKGKYRYTSKDLIAGPFGIVPYASLCTGPPTFRPPVPARKKVGGELFVLGGVLPDELYSIEVYTGPELTEEHRGAILDFLRTGVTASCELADRSWSLEEIKKRWNASVSDPKVREGLEKPIRTKHYVILTNASAGALFAKKMEEAYRRVQKIFPFPEVEGRRLMPVFLFRMRDQYVDFTVKNTSMNREAAAQTKGHAYLDYYATYYDSPRDPVHIHEATHQIFKNRIRLAGGGSWFQEGVAEYVSSSRNERKAFAKRAAKDGKHIPFRNFVGIPSIISNPYLGGGASYLQAASLIEFLRDSKFQPEKFPDFLEEIGRLNPSVPEIDATIQRVYGVNLEGLEEAWVKYWARR